MELLSAGFSEIEHTADWEIKVWAPDLISLFEQAAFGMYTISGTRLDRETREIRQIELHAIDPESLLVSFLSELLYITETQHLGFDEFHLFIKNNNMRATIKGSPVAYQIREIKAVTFHNLQIKASPTGLEVFIVFDV